MQSRSPRQQHSISYKSLVSFDTPENLRFHAVSNWFDHRSYGSNVQPFVAHGMGEIVYHASPYSSCISRVRQIPNQVLWFSSNPTIGFSAAATFLSKCLLRVKHLLIPDHVITCPGYLVCYCFYRNHFVCLCTLPLIISPYICIVAYRFIGCLHIGPR